MSNLNATISVYDIVRSGFFTQRGESLGFGSTQQMLTDLKGWIGPMQLAETKTHNDETGDTYVANLLGGPTGWLLTTFNEQDGLGKGLVKVDPTSKVGSVTEKVLKTNATANELTGYYSYFWILPDLDLLITIVPKGQTHNGHPKLKVFLESFQAKFSRHVLKTKTEDGEIEISYLDDTAVKKDDNGDEDFNEIKEAVPRFRTRSKRSNGELEKLVKNFASIKKVFFKNSIKPIVNAQNKKWWRSTLGLCGEIVPTEREVKNPIRFKLDFSYTPTEKELRGMIETASNYPEKEKWDNIGFSFDGDGGKVTWVSKVWSKTNMVLNVDFDPPKKVDGEKLLIALQSVQKIIVDGDSNESQED